MKMLILAVLLCLSFAGMAQNAPEAEPTALERALALIPDAEFVHDGVPAVSFADYPAALAARGFLVPPNWASWAAARLVPIHVALPRSGPARMLQTIMQGAPDYPATVGFDFFQIEQAVEIGTPPSSGVILIGDFDRAAIAAAHIARGYTIEQESDAGVLLCPAAGCESGHQINLRERNMGNPFGGDLGRSEPIFVGDGVLLNSADFAVLQALIDVYTADAPALAEMPAYQTVAHVLADYPNVGAVTTLSPHLIGVLDFGPNVTEAQREQLMSELDGEPVPPFALAAFASAGDSDSEYGLAIIAYPDAETAAAAAAIIDTRLKTATSMVMPGRTYADILEEAGTLQPAQVVVDDATGAAAVMVELVGEQPSTDPVDGRLVFSHMPFDRFARMWITRDANWLLWQMPE